MLFYRAALPLSRRTLTFVSGLIRAHRKELGSVWRRLDPGRQALLVLVCLRKGEPFAEVGAGFGVSTTTCWRYAGETVELLARRAPRLRAASGVGETTGVWPMWLSTGRRSRSTGSPPIGRSTRAVMIVVCYLGPRLDPYSGWPCCLVFDLSAVVGGGACCRRSGGACPDRGLAVQGTVTVLTAHTGSALAIHSRAVQESDDHDQHAAVGHRGR